MNTIQIDTERKLSKEEILFIKDNYRDETLQSGCYILYAYKLHQSTDAIKKSVQDLLKKEIGIYSSQSGHVVPKQYLNNF